MEYHRYGKFSFSDYIGAWFAIFFLLALVVGGLIMHIPLYLLIWPLIFSTMMAWSIYKPNHERFYISGDIIAIKRGSKTQEITIPNEPTLIVSYADLCPPLAMRTSYGNETYMLKGKYAISILQKMPLETVLERLHPKYARKYTSSTIEAYFDEYLFIYSFVCNQALLDQLLTNRHCQLIIPESLLERVTINHSEVNVHIDTGY